MEFQKLKDEENKERHNIIKQYKEDNQKKARENKIKRREHWFKKKEVHTFF